MCGQRAVVGFFVHRCNARDDEGHDWHLPTEPRVGARRGHVPQVRSRAHLYLTGGPTSFSNAVALPGQRLHAISNRHTPTLADLDCRAVNADLFRAADLSFSVESLPLNQPLLSLPVASASRFSAIDAAFNSSIVGLHTAMPLGDVVRPEHAGWS